MLILSRLLRFAIFGFSIYVLTGIVPISVSQWQGQNACPALGPVPACYIVSASYFAMGTAAIFWNANLTWLFLAGALPVNLLAATGTSLEAFGHPTCPLSTSGVPLCYYSLAAGSGMLVTYSCALFLKKRFA